MKLTKCVLGIIIVVAIAGCATCPGTERERCQNVSMANSLLDESVGNAVLTQRTIWPWHFVSGTAVLNELGERDLELLSEHLKEHAGTLHVRGGEDKADLRQARLARVKDFLREKGVDVNKVAIDKGLPGGEGLPSGDVIKALAAGKGKPAATGAPAATKAPQPSPPSPSPASK